jgi:hypothetical protein
LAYNFTRAGGSTGEARGFRTDTTNAAFFNCTGYNCVNNFSESGSGTDNVAKNCAGLGHAGGADFSGTWHASSTHNASSDTSAPGSSALKSLTTSDQFVDVTSGSEDLHLKVGADLIGAGVDLSSDFINDLDGHARIVPWDIGADGVPLVTQMATASRFVAGGVHRRVR